jgi:hypothetical protein
VPEVVPVQVREIFIVLGIEIFVYTAVVIPVVHPHAYFLGFDRFWVLKGSFLRSGDTQLAVAVLNLLRLGAGRPVFLYIDIFIVDMRLFILVGSKHISFDINFSENIIVFVHLGNESI